VRVAYDILHTSKDKFTSQAISAHNNRP